MGRDVKGTWDPCKIFATGSIPVRSTKYDEHGESGGSDLILAVSMDGFNSRTLHLVHEGG